MKLGKPPVGRFKKTVENDVAYIEWSPGNSTRYEMIVVRLGMGLSKALAGNYLVSISSMGTTQNVFMSYVVSAIGLLHESLVAEKFSKHYGSDQDLIMWTCLLNWVLYEDETCRGYAQELWDEAAERWNLTSPVA